MLDFKAVKTDLGGMTWKPCYGFEDYILISEYGDIYQLDSVRKYGLNDTLKLSPEKERKPYIAKNGYKCIGLFNKPRYVHRMVAETFLGVSDLFVNHIDGNKLNNHISNLEWCTNIDNLKHYQVVLNKKKRGAYKQSNHDSWSSIIGLNGKEIYLGNFKTKEDAHEAYRIKFKKHYGVEPW